MMNVNEIADAMESPELPAILPGAGNPDMWDVLDRDLSGDPSVGIEGGWMQVRYKIPVVFNNDDISHLMDIGEFDEATDALSRHFYALDGIEWEVMDGTLYARFSVDVNRMGPPDPIGEDQIKSPSSAHRLRQSAYRQSFGRSRSFGGVTEGGQA